MWKNMVEPDVPQIIIWRTHTACWIPESTNTHLEYVILLFHCNNGYSNALQCFVKRTLPILFDYAISDEKLPSDFSYIFLSTTCSSRCPIASYTRSSSWVEAGVVWCGEVWLMQPPISSSLHVFPCSSLQETVQCAERVCCRLFARIVHSYS